MERSLFYRFLRSSRALLKAEPPRLASFRFLIPGFAFLLPLALFAQEKGEEGFPLEEDPLSRPSIELGFEWGSLYQEAFRDIGKRNFSYLLAYRGGDEHLEGMGFRLMGVHVRLTPARLRNHQGISFVDDPSEGASGALHTDRLYFDLYPLRFGILEWDEERYLLLGAIGVSPSLGYDRWRIQPAKSRTSFLLNAMSLGISVRGRVRIMEYLFFEYPFLDLFTFLYRGPSQNSLGPGKRRIESDRFGLFSWGTIGLSFPLSRP